MAWFNQYLVKSNKKDHNILWSMVLPAGIEPTTSP